MSKEIVIQCTKMTLVLYENELIKALPQELLFTALKRGKGYKRAVAVENRQQIPRGGTADV